MAFSAVSTDIASFAGCDFAAEYAKTPDAVVRKNRSRPISLILAGLKLPLMRFYLFVSLFR
jgi:hypothetical protein